MNACERFLKEYKLNKQSLPGQHLHWLIAWRENALQSFAEQGLPDSSNESWKYTQLTRLQETKYRLARRPPETALALKLNESSLEAHFLVFVDGYYAAQLSSLGALPEGVILCSFAQALQEHPQLLAAELGKTGGYQDHPFSALNSALFADGVFLWAPQNSFIKQPVHCLFISSAGKHPQVSYPRLLLVLKNHAQLTLIEHYIDLPETNNCYNFCNSVTEISLGAHASLNHYKLQCAAQDSSHIAAMTVQQQQASAFTSHSYSLGAALARHDIQIALAGRQAACSLNGAYLVDGSQHVDYHTQITHLAPACNSQQLYKGVVQGHARAVFNGAVIIDPVAQQSNAKQLNRNLLLGDNGEVDSKPELQIYADDVICTHGATVGQLDSQALFYLQSRGFSKEEAQAWLVYGFVSELLDRIDNPALRKFIEQPVSAYLARLFPTQFPVRLPHKEESADVLNH